MSNLIKPYTISVWDDVWDEDTKSFKERKYAVIGSDTMQSQNAVIDPILSRNVNGTKRLTFQLCKRYKDSLTGEQITNPFADYLISERKIKLKYDNKWYDFIVKNINEDSSQYIYTYTCEDAHVVELSKNGFDVSLNSESANNSDTLGVLAARVMEGTDWDVISEVPVQTLVENLVYVRTNKEISAIKILDQNKDNRNSGVTFEYTDEEKTNVQTTSIAEGTTLLAFYSSCRNRPPHFQFIKLDEKKINGKQVLMDEDGVIIEENCQYYIEYLNTSSYLAPDVTYGFSLPDGFSIILKNPSVENTDTTISSWYKGARYNFSQKSDYEPKLKRYVNIYSKDGEEYRGYSKTEIISPEFIENCVSNPDFKATSGWIGSWKLNPSGTSKKEKSVVVESAYGRFKGKEFISAVDDLGKVDSNKKPYTHSSYLKVTFPVGQNQDGGIPCLINSGPYDFRSKIGFLEEQKNWIFELYGINNTPIKKKYYSIIIADSTFNPDKNGYITLNTDADRIKISTASDDDATSLSFTVTKNSYTDKKDFIENSNVRIFIYPKEKTEGDNDYPFFIEEDENGNKKIVMYLKKCLFFKENRDENGTLIYPLDSLPQGTSGNLPSTKKTEYFYYKRDELDNILEPEDFIPSINLENPSYDIYKPQFNMNAEKIRSVTVKESNFFNILQTLAETFEMWMVLEPEHDEQGNITRKKILFKKTIGKKNYANFRYGVNLKDIKRVYESKSLVTKLIVKQNSNEFAKNGFCTISRAASNPIGENVIYDFQYYFNAKLLNARDHLDSLYSLNGAQGEDIPNSTEGTNCLGYYPRMRALNDKMDEIIEQSTNCNNGLITLKAKAEVQKQKKKAAESECAEAADTYQKITNGGNIFNFPALDDETKEKYLQRSDLKRVLDQYTVYATQGREASEAYNSFILSISTKEKALSVYEVQFKQYRDQKIELNKAFYSKYSRFIQEGTWINEEYVDDEKYYADAKSVLYNSCYPQVAYSINVLALSAMPGYELFSFQLGDQTYAEDPNFFGSDIKEEVVLTEIVEHLSSPEKNSIKVQNFKNQFQDLFQKITATVQQAQYRTGSYEKAVALSEATQQRKYQFLTDALAGANVALSAAGQQTVRQGPEGLIITEDNSPNELRLVAGAILLKTQDENGLDKYVSALTTQGFSANLITAGSLNTGSISIMNGSEPTFRWDSFGISAFSFVESEGVISSIDSHKFVRMDKYGIYGINTSSASTENSGTTSVAIDGTSWHATSYDDILNYASFALTWEGLKVSGNENVIALLGKQEDCIFKVTKQNEENETICTFSITNNGEVRATGLKIINGTIEENSEEYPLANIKKVQGLYYSVAEYLGIDGENIIVSPYIGGGCLVIASTDPDDKSKVVIDPSNLRDIDKPQIFQVYNKDDVMVIGLDDGGNAIFKGNITAEGGSIGGFSIGGIWLYNPNETVQLAQSLYYNLGTDQGTRHSTINNSSFLLCPKGLVYNKDLLGQSGKNWKLIIGTKFGVDNTGTLYANGAQLTSVTAKSGTFGKLSIADWKGNTNFGGLSTGKGLNHEGLLYDVTSDSSGIGIAGYDNGGFITVRYWGSSSSWNYTYQNASGFSFRSPRGVVELGEGGLSFRSYAKNATGRSRGKITCYDASNMCLEFPPDYAFLIGQYGFSYNTDQTSTSTRQAMAITKRSSGDYCINFYGTLGGYFDTGSGSDKHLKKEISQFDSRYESFFDLLTPVKYRYISPIGGRDCIRSGFIAQDVENSLLVNGLSKEDWGGLILPDDVEQYYRLIYSEFIALNTWQIQKLKPRMTAAEQEIVSLKLEIQSLRTELENLKNS